MGSRIVSRRDLEFQLFEVLDVDFYRGKLAACRYFFRWELPCIGPQLALLDSLDSTCLETQPAVTR